MPRWLWLALVLLLTAPAAASAQVRPDTVPRDTVRRDTTVRVAIPPEQVEQDTLPADSLLAMSKDTLVAPIFPRYPQPLPMGWGAGRWEFGRELLRRYHGQTILAFLERVPGLGIVRSGDHGYPAGITALGLGGGRVQLLLDGFELDPIGAGTPELQHLGTADLESVRVERSPAGIRIELNTLRLPEKRPYSAVELGTGTYDSKLLRGVLIRSYGGKSILSGAYDAISTRGFGFRAPFNLASMRASWSYALSERTGLQLEFRNTGIQRSGQTFVENADRRTLLLRGRSELLPNLFLDGAIGRNSRAPGGDDDVLSHSLQSTQGFLRASYALPRAWVEGSARFRTGELESSALPGLQLATRGVFRPLPWVSAEAEARTTSVGGAGALVWSATARAGQPGGLSVFATLAGGEQGLGIVRDTTWEEPGDEGVPRRRTEVRYSATSASVGAVRVGTEWSRAGAAIGAAAVLLSPTTIAPFGLAFDRAAAAVDADAATGVESYASTRVPGTGDLVRLEGAFTQWLERGGRPYLPSFQGRAALVVHDQFFDGQLEPTLRVDLNSRGAMSTLSGEGGTAAESAAYTLLNLFLEIRILEVQAFGIFENLLNYRVAEDVPGRPLPGQRLVYGLRWVFRD